MKNKDRIRRVKKAILLWFAMLLTVCLLPSQAYAAEVTVRFGSEYYDIKSGEIFPIGVYIEADSRFNEYEILIEYDTHRIEYVEGADRLDEETGKLILKGEVNLSRLKYRLKFKPISGGEAYIKISSAKIIHRNEDNEEDFDIAGLGEAPIHLKGEDTALEQERLEQERLEKERLDQERLEQERLEKERLEQERLEQERAEQERLKQQQADTQEAEKISEIARDDELNELSKLLITDRTKRIVTVVLAVVLIWVIFLVVLITKIRKERNRNKSRKKVVSKKSANKKKTAVKNVSSKAVDKKKEIQRDRQSDDDTDNDLIILDDIDIHENIIDNRDFELTEGDIDMDFDLKISFDTAPFDAVDESAKELVDEIAEVAEIEAKSDNEDYIQEEASQNTDSEAVAIEEKHETPVISIHDVCMDYKIATSNASGIKDYLIQMLKKQMTHRELKALDHVSFDVYKGEIVGIIGTNGSGKSTLLKIVSGALRPTSGSVDIDRKKVQLLTLGTGFDMELTARENVYLNGAIIGYTREFIDSHYDEIVAFAELEGFMDEKVKNFSSGMVSRLGFAIATVGDAAEILILDEVLSVGDEFFKKKSLKRIKEMIHGGSTVLMVSHGMGTIKDNCTKAVWIEKGELRMVGDPKEVCKAYSNMNDKSA